MSDLAALARWYLALTVISAALLPFGAWLGSRLGGARYGLLRPLSLVVLTGVVWWPAVALHTPFSRASLVVALVALAIVGWGLWWRHGLNGLNLRALAAFEAAWLATFLLYAWFRGFHPDIAYTEKPMEIALLSSISRSNAAPAPDPWFAGSAINYYYFGYQMVASLVKLSGVPPVIGFNLALATLFASAATTAAAIGAAIATRVKASAAARGAAGALTAVLLLLAGNLETARRLLRDARATINAGWWDGVGWQASRIIVDHDITGAAPGPRPTINEFPAFSFVLGDLHPHVLAYPLLAVVVALAVGLLLDDAPPRPACLAATGALTGLLYAANSWDAPLGFAVAAAAAGLALRFEWRAWLRAALPVAGGAIVAAAPFILTFDPPVGVANPDVPRWLDRLPVVGTLARTFGVVTWHPTVLRELLLVHGAWLAVFALFAAWTLARDRAYVTGIRARGDVVLIVALLSVAAAIVWVPALVVLGWPLALAVWIAARERDRAARAVAGLFAVGFLLALVPEFFYIQDVFGDRMNTVFKLYFQAWLLLSLASAGALTLLGHAAGRRARPAVAVAVVALLAVTLPYVRLSAWDWSGQFTERQGLDGAAFIARASPGDAAAIAWVRANAKPGDTLVEAPGCSYIEYGGVPLDRVSAFTGVPTVVGWAGHEDQWRRGQLADIGAVLAERAAAANAILDGGPPSATQPEPTFLILGRPETTPIAGCNLTVARGADAAQQLEQAGWRLAFESSGTQVFQRDRAEGATSFVPPARRPLGFEPR